MIVQVCADMEQPTYKTRMSAGFDISSRGEVKISPRGIEVVSTGLFLAPEASRVEGLELQIRSRSGLASRGIVVANSPGTVDMDYKAEIKVILANLTDNEYIVRLGDRIAQGVFAAIVRPSGIEVLDEDREGGFGSTGK